MRYETLVKLIYFFQKLIFVPFDLLIAVPILISGKEFLKNAQQMFRSGKLYISITLKTFELNIEFA